jgi:hypothetical protein
MPVLEANFAALGSNPYLLDNNAKFTVAWTTKCTQDPSLATDKE